MESRIDYYDRKTGEGVYVLSGKDIINDYYCGERYTVAEHMIKLEKYSQPDRGSYFLIEDVGIITGDRYVVVSNVNDLKILRREELEAKYSKYKRIRSKFLKIERENTITYVELNTINNIEFIKNDNGKYIHISHKTGWETINFEDVLNYDEVEEILKNYVEE